MFESIQAKILAVILVIEMLAISISIAMSSGLYAFAFIPLYLLFAIPVSLLYVFNQNCLVIGGCRIWSWIRLFIIIATLLAAMSIVIYSRVKKNQEEEQKKAAQAPKQAPQPPTTVPSVTMPK